MADMVKNRRVGRDGRTTTHTTHTSLRRRATPSHLPGTLPAWRFAEDGTGFWKRVPSPRPVAPWLGDASSQSPAYLPLSHLLYNSLFCPVCCCVSLLPDSFYIITSIILSPLSLYSALPHLTSLEVLSLRRWSDIYLWLFSFVVWSLPLPFEWTLFVYSFFFLLPYCDLEVVFGPLPCALYASSYHICISYHLSVIISILSFFICQMSSHPSPFSPSYP